MVFTVRKICKYFCLWRSLTGLLEAWFRLIDEIHVCMEREKMSCVCVQTIWYVTSFHDRNSVQQYQRFPAAVIANQDPVLTALVTHSAVWALLTWRMKMMRMWVYAVLILALREDKEWAGRLRCVIQTTIDVVLATFWMVFR